jgi:serralysin
MRLSENLGSFDRDTSREDSMAVINGTINDDIIDGTSEDDEIDGLEGNDTINGGDGNDVLFGREGDDILNAGTGDNFMIGGPGSDTYVGGTGNGENDWDKISYETLGGARGFADVTFLGNGAVSIIDPYGDTDTGTGIDEVKGTKNADIFRGSSGNDRVEGMAGDDIIQLGAGTRDRAAYNHETDGGATHGVIVNLSAVSVTANIGTGFKTVAAGRALDSFNDTDTLSGVEEIRATKFRDFVAGNASANKLEGQEGNDILLGNGGADSIFGQNGSDRLTGGRGADYLSGGAGVDRFIYNFANEGGDTIEDFGSADFFQFEGSAFGLGSYAGTLKAANFVSRASGHAAGDANDRFIFDRAKDQLWFDPDGTGRKAAVMIADLDTNFNLTASDILIV